MVSWKEWGGSLYSLFHDSVQPFAWFTGKMYRTPQLLNLSKRRSTLLVSVLWPRLHWQKYNVTCVSLEPVCSKVCYNRKPTVTRPSNKN